MGFQGRTGCFADKHCLQPEMSHRIPFNCPALEKKHGRDQDRRGESMYY